MLKNDEVLRRKTRAHGNFIEYVPLALVLMAMLELSGGAPLYLWIGGFALLTARMLHGIGQRFSDGPQLRGMGMLVGHVCYLIGALYLISLNL